MEQSWSLPLSRYDRVLVQIAKNHYVQIFNRLFGIKLHYHSPGIYGVILAVGLSLGAVLFLIAKFIKTHWEQPLTTNLALKLLGYWAALQILLTPYQYMDFFAHHNWKITTNNEPPS